MPVKFGISFTRRTLNQANALVNIYLDGTIQVSTGGTEMGQGLNTKIRQLVADEFALPLEAVRVMPASTEKNNNTSPTAASASTDLNGTAALRACETLKEPARRGGRAPFRLGRRRNRAFADAHPLRARGRASTFAGPASRLDFRELVRLAYEERVDLGARGFYATPGVDFNRETGRGNPFLYFTNGAAVSEVVIDRLTGELAVTRVDILMDLGRSLNPAIDRGQVIGGFVQGMGWVTTEELLYSETGELLSHSPNNYKIPSVECMPARLPGRLPRESRQPDQPARQQGRGRAAVCAGDQRLGGRQVRRSSSLVAGPLAGPVLPGHQRGDLETSAREIDDVEDRPTRDTVTGRRMWRTKSVPEPKSEEEFMSLAIAKAREGIAAGQSPFGAIIVRGGEVVAATHNTVWRDTDPTAHAEVNCIRSAARALEADRPERLRDVFDMRALPDVPGRDPLGEDRSRRLRRDDRRRRDGRLLRAARRCQAPGRDGQEPAQGRERPACARSARELFELVEEDRPVRDVLSARSMFDARRRACRSVSERRSRARAECSRRSHPAPDPGRAGPGAGRPADHRRAGRQRLQSPRRAGRRGDRRRPDRRRGLLRVAGEPDHLGRRGW